jgi:hypothetical protein
MIGAFRAEYSSCGEYDYLEHNRADVEYREAKGTFELKAADNIHRNPKDFLCPYQVKTILKRGSWPVTK